MTEQLIEAFNRIAAAMEDIADAQKTIAARYTDPKPDGKEDEAIAFIKDNPSMTVENTVAGLAAKGIVRGRLWVKTKRLELGLSLGRRTESPKQPKAPKKPKNSNARPWVVPRVDESTLSAAEIQALEAKAIEIIKGVLGGLEMHYLRANILNTVGIDRSPEWIDAQR